MKGRHNKKSVRVEFVMSRSGGRTGKRTHGGTWHYQPVGISAKDGRRRLHHSP